MPITPSQRKTHEWVLLFVAVGLVGAACYPAWQWLNLHDQPPEGNEWLVKLFTVAKRAIGPVQIACYVCFSWAVLILLSRYLEVKRQRRAFKLGLLPTDEGFRILPEDARPLQRKVDQVASRKGPYILANMIRLALGKYAVSKSSKEVSETIQTQAEVDLGRLVSTMSTVHYLAWALPALGFLGTVAGLAGSLSLANQMDEAGFIVQVARHLTIAFDCTLVALALSLVVMFLLHSIQRDEESLVIDCRQYCLEHLVNRLYEMEPVHETV